MEVSVATQAGSSAPNEDWVAATTGLAVVLDGLSTGGLDTGCRHGVPWYVANLGGQLIAALTNKETTLEDGLAIAIDNVARLHAECDLNNPGTPSATVSLLREREDHFEYLVLADSPIAFETSSGSDLVTDLRVESVLPELKAETERFPTGSAEHTESVARLIVAQREIRNTPVGYWIAAATPEAAHHSITGAKKRGDVLSIALMSDGASRLVTDYGQATWPAVFELLKSHGPRALIEAVRRVEETDPQGRRWPRYKSGDDATVAFCRPWPTEASDAFGQG